jgi:hypothetical protein
MITVGIWQKQGQAESCDLLASLSAPPQLWVLGRRIRQGYLLKSYQADDTNSYYANSRSHFAAH